MPDTTHPALTPERETFRQQFGVRLVTGREEGSNLHRLPEGVYGYATAAGPEEIPVFAKPIFQSFEVHKLADGEICYVGYLSEKEYQAVQNGTEPVSVSLYPEPHSEADKLISIALSRIGRVKQPSRDHGNWMKLDVGRS